MIQTSKLKPAYPKKDWISTKSMNRNASITHGLIVLVNFTFIPIVKLMNTMNQFLQHSLTLENGEMSDIIMLIWFALSKKLMKIQQIQWCQLVFPSEKLNIVEKTVFSQSFHPHGIFHTNEASMTQNEVWFMDVGQHQPQGIPYSGSIKQTRLKSMKKSLILCKFCTHQPMTYFSTCYRKVRIDLFIANIRNSDFLFEPMMVSLPTHICVTRPQWDNANLMPTNIFYWFIQVKI